MVPFKEGVMSFKLDFDLQVEPGNLLWALLGDTGLAGTVLFAVAVIIIFALGEKRNLHLLAAAFLVNMGEMVFFSSNNMAILVWFLIALYISAPKEDDYESTPLPCR